MRVGGVFIILMGLVFLGSGAGAGSQRQFAPSWAPKPDSWGHPWSGPSFGLGWAPCTGPTLAAVMTLSASTTNPSTGRAVTLATAYALGLGCHSSSRPPGSNASGESPAGSVTTTASFRPSVEGCSSPSGCCSSPGSGKASPVGCKLSLCPASKCRSDVPDRHGRSSFVSLLGYAGCLASVWSYPITAGLSSTTRWIGAGSLAHSVAQSSCTAMPPVGLRRRFSRSVAGSQRAQLPGLP
ncbi:cytochrome c biogenesis CcdA family protein [Knoellia subterranea]|uniref:cytochrome c biogenesis CcdA family protein n=1 Tax=Knoellia subterranea TaxID=184882 RepID=UPI001FDEAD5F|nr:cytochrome c biogenesis protein CcdA [Knoellia subterranea]